MAFHFEKPAGFTFEPGQCGDFTLTKPSQTDAEGNTRSFSLACASFEDDLIITTRMRDTAFKRSLKLIGLEPSSTSKPPWGELTLHKDTSIPAVFLTGGIGITPVRSIVLEATHDKLAHPLAFYSNRTPSDAAFLDELAAAQGSTPLHPHRHYDRGRELLQTVGRRNGLHHRSDAEKESPRSQPRPSTTSPGPPAMVTATQKLLKGAGIKETDIRAEEFSGY